MSAITRRAVEFYRDCGAPLLAGLPPTAAMGISYAVHGHLRDAAAVAACAAAWAGLGCLRVRRVRRDPAGVHRLGVLAAAARLTSRALYWDPVDQVTLTCWRSWTGTQIHTGGPHGEAVLSWSGQAVAAHTDVLSRAYLITPGRPRVECAATMITVTLYDDATATTASSGTLGQRVRGVLIRGGMLPAVAGTDARYAGEAELAQLTEQIRRARLTGSEPPAW